MTAGCRAVNELVSRALFIGDEYNAIRNLHCQDTIYDTIETFS